MAGGRLCCTSSEGPGPLIRLGCAAHVTLHHSTFSRASRFRTVLSCQAPPRAVRMPRAFSAAAIARCVVAPAASIWRTIGNTFAAKASAAARLASAPLALASAR